ncbi:MAG: polysaccharide deacetylase family protein [Chloroflexota bacterium]
MDTSQRCLIYRHGARTGNNVALTFDDGPNPPITEQMLTILAEHDAKATFFLMGKWVDKYPESVRRIVAGGHLVGNHTYVGRRNIGDYDEAQAAIGHITGEACTYFRAHSFDYGAYFQSNVSRFPGSIVVDADVNPSDFACTDPDEIIRRVLEDPELGPGSIINLHDSGEMEDAGVRMLRPQATLAALPQLIVALKERGFQCARVDELELVDPIEWNWPRTTDTNKRFKPAPASRP